MLGITPTKRRPGNNMITGPVMRGPKKTAGLGGDHPLTTKQNACRTPRKENGPAAEARHELSVNAGRGRHAALYQVPSYPGSDGGKIRPGLPSQLGSQTPSHNPLL